MQYRKMGKLDFKVSALGLGAMRLPGRKKAVDLIRRGIDLGINYIDTAMPYGLGSSERILGEALLDGYREKVFLVTKLFMPMVNKAEDFDRHLENQLNKLQTTYVDAYLFHGLSESSFQKVLDLGLIKKMEEAKERGLIKHIGFSFHDTLPVFKRIVDHYDWDLTYIQYNYLDTAQQATTDGLEYAASKDIAVVIMEPLKGGILANPPKNARALLHSSSIKRSPVDWALQFLWNKKEVAAVISGMSSIPMLEENCRSAANSGVGSLSAKELKILEQIEVMVNRSILVPCTACQYCMPCPFGVNIPDNFAILNNSNIQVRWVMDALQKWRQKGKYRKLASTEKQLNPESPNGNGSFCRDCGKCLDHCPQKIDIPCELKKAHEVLKKGRKASAVFGK